MRTFLEVIKDLELIDVHIPNAGGDEQKPRARKKPVPKPAATEVDVDVDKEWSITVPVTKINDEIGVIYGWANVTHEGGQIVTDRQGDQIDEHEMLKAAHDFMLSSRAGGLMHVPGVRAGDVVESLFFSTDLQKALGIDLGKVGWLIGYKPSDPDVLKAAKAGDLSAFSIGGTATAGDD